jgi:hypothetical protein
MVLTMNKFEEARNDLRKFHDFQIEARKQGIGLGDLLEKLITYFKLKELLNLPENCPGCIARKAVLNHLRLNGWKINWEDFKKHDNS